MELRTIVGALHLFLLYFEFDFFDLFAGQRSIVGYQIRSKVRISFVRWHQIADQIGLVHNLVVVWLEMG